MFTGIVEEVGTVRRVLPGARAGKLTIAARKVLDGTGAGDSIAVNGVCLTVVELGEDCFTADVMPETLSKTGLAALSAGSPVDLERAMPADGRFGGHIVSGHIDGVGTIGEKRRDQNAVRMRIAAPESILSLVVEKGSIAVDGVSLTVSAVSPSDFEVSIIPRTGEETILLGKRAGDSVNLENDIVGKYVQKLLGAGAAPSCTDGGRGAAGLSLGRLEALGF